MKTMLPTLVFVFATLLLPNAYAESAPSKGSFIPGTSGITLPSLSLSFANNQKPSDMVSALRIVMMLTVLSLAPSILIMTTSFTRIVVVLGFLRQALGTQQMPPNQILVGLALFLTFFIMAPTIKNISANAIDPYMN